MGSVQVVDCGSILDITVVMQWREQALAALKAGGSLSLNAENLQRVDAAGLQALLALVIAAEQNSIQLHWENPSPVLQKAADLLGLREELHFN